MRTRQKRARRERGRRERGRRERGRRLAADAALLLLATAFALPLVWLLLASLDPGADLRVRAPSTLTGENFRAVLTDEIAFTPMLNSLLLCGGATAVTVVCAALAAYPLSRHRARWARPYLLTVLFTTCLPITAVMVPVYALFVRVELIDTRYGTALFMAASQLPFALWLTKNFMDAVPLVLEEAAWTDGASGARTLTRVVLPLMGPGLTVVTVYTFIQLWGNFFVPFMLILTPERLPASVSVYTFFGNYGSVVYGQLAAFSILYSLPVLLLYVLIARRLGGGFALGGAVKG
ncbi:carbohydrate ABC transporter permease [Streptomyces clavuligerus]|uniref:Integral membrane transport protein n=1 Tax=Streptomyces clavuligerus TaxID=1901 RepID=B5GKZ4_STRCL|nr:carbohydrate ABC transporter permease [Streptomyces clavuligerus]ANW18017.1 sugar ABC transporter permease [Streptomyces clavuligerus]AXU12578.1 carbohydrate ABC transporter permease [Streptomyces clavuligerus]EDY46990.1 ABC transporter permease protein [Streptomyces clavuligerus]EFG09406.1 Integral membrane transport protein [Streptomyces clavuligerus]MBY6302478.1 carbohydrate ABC transporter permease [Streptomyces clavuligerus]